MGINLGLTLSNRLTGSNCRIQLVSNVTNRGSLPKLLGEVSLHLVHTNFSTRKVDNALVMVCNATLSSA